MMQGPASSEGEFVAASSAACGEGAFMKGMLAWETAKGAVRFVSMYACHWSMVSWLRRLLLE